MTMPTITQLPSRRKAPARWQVPSAPVILPVPSAQGQTATVLPFPRRRTASPFDELTFALVMERHRRGDLDPAILAALLAGVGLELPQ
jgi:hypothetical protein